MILPAQKPLVALHYLQDQDGPQSATPPARSGPSARNRVELNMWLLLRGLLILLSPASSSNALASFQGPGPPLDSGPWRISADRSCFLQQTLSKD